MPQRHGKAHGKSTGKALAFLSCARHPSKVPCLHSITNNRFIFSICPPFPLLVMLEIAAHLAKHCPLLFLIYSQSAINPKSCATTADLVVLWRLRNVCVPQNSAFRKGDCLICMKTRLSPSLFTRSLKTGDNPLLHAAIQLLIKCLYLALHCDEVANIST